MKPKSIFTFLVKLPKTLEKRVIFFKKTVHIGSLFLPQASDIQQQNHINSITDYLFFYRTRKVFSYHTTRLLPILSAEMETALGVTNLILRPQLQKVGAVSLE